MDLLSLTKLLCLCCCFHYHYYYYPYWQCQQHLIIIAVYSCRFLLLVDKVRRAMPQHREFVLNLSSLWFPFYATNCKFFGSFVHFDLYIFFLKSGIIFEHLTQDELRLFERVSKLSLMSPPVVVDQIIFLLQL